MIARVREPGGRFKLSLNCAPESTATLTVLTTPRARFARSVIRWQWLISRSKRVAIRAKVTRKSGWERPLARLS
jgi:hypothetical protein